MSSIRKVALAAVLLITAACGSPASDGSGGAAEVGTVPWQHEGIAFEHPANWTWLPFKNEVHAKGATVLGYLATTPIDLHAICPGSKKHPKCDVDSYELQPGTLAVTITTGHGLSADVWQDEPAADATALTAGGMPALLREGSDADKDVLLSWSIARPGATGGWYQLDAELRGPGDAAMRQQLDALVASIAFEPAVEPLPTDNRSLSDMAFEAMQRLKADKHDGALFGCFLDRPGVRPGVVERLPGARPLSGKLPVGCSFRAEATRWNAWRLSLKYSWAALGDRSAGSWLVTQWVTVDGKLGARSAGGDRAP
jgi:hypothetical protein